MASTCDTCGTGLSFTQRARGRTRCDACTERVKTTLARALGDYDGALQAAAADPEGTAINRLRDIESSIVAHGGDVKARKGAFYRSFLDRALADEALTAEEEALLDRVGGALYPDGDQDSQIAILRDYRSRIVIASVNADRLPQSTDATIMLKRGEVQHLAEPAALMKEVIKREWQSGSRGYSFRIMKGVSYRVGNTRGKMVEVGRALEPIDHGALALTSQRAVFTGERKSMEMPYAKLIDLNVYTDAIQFHLSGRASPPMFRVTDGPMVAAVINAAIQRTL